MGRRQKGAWYKGVDVELPAKWSAGEAPKVCTKCDYVDDKGFRILIHPDVLAAVFHLTREIKMEWQMLLSGAVLGQEVMINGYYIPKQEVTSSTVTNLEAIDQKFIDDRDIVATIHSHSDMGVFFSQVDDEYTNMSWIKHHVVVNNKGEFVAKSRHDLKCGGVKFVDSKVETMIPTATKAEGVENISKKVWSNGGWGSHSSGGTNNNNVGHVGRHYPADEDSYYSAYDKAHAAKDEYIPWWMEEENAYVKVDGVWVPKSRLGGV